MIEEFETIKDSVEDSIYNAFALKIEEDDENEDLIPLMNECIRLTTQNEKLKYQYSSYVADLCISKVNADEINNLKALSLMKDVYKRQQPHKPTQGQSQKSQFCHRTILYFLL